MLSCIMRLITRLMMRLISHLMMRLMTRLIASNKHLKISLKKKLSAKIVPSLIKRSPPPGAGLGGARRG
jgi:hypothetical protein